MTLNFETNPIDFLVSRKFPESRSNVLATLGPLSRVNALTGPRSPEQRLKRERAIAVYREELSRLPAEELEALFDAETNKYHAEIRTRLELEESSRFFNQPHVSADIDHWSRAAHWTIDEAVSLSFGKEPQIVNWSTIQSFKDVSPFVRQYCRLLDLARRAIAWEQLFDPVFPGIFIGWTQRNEIPFPVALEQAVRRRGNHIINWKASYDELLALAEARQSEWNEIAEKWKQLAERRKEEADELRSQHSPATAEQAIPHEAPLGKRERESMLKMIAAMAIGGYGHDPAAARTDTVQSIVEDIERTGMVLSDDTVRRYLKEAMEFLNEEKA